MIDTHTHIYHKEFAADREAMIARAREAGVTHILLPNIDLESLSALAETCEQFPGICLPMMGLHPCSVGDDWRQQLDSIGATLFSGSYIAVGEIGLDRHWDLTHYQAQVEALEVQFAWALELNLPVSIHSRKATDEVMKIARPFMEKGMQGVLHCFGGSAQQARKAIDMGFLLGIGGVITYHNSNLHQEIQGIDPAFFVLETDAPYLSPVPYRGKRNEPAYLEYINAKLAGTLGISESACEAITDANARKLFRLL
jgi:TatD DNase family protein